MRAYLLAIWEVLEIILIATITVFVIRSFIVQPFLVSGASMEPNFSSGNYLLVDEITYQFRDPQRGEVIVFRYPRNPSVFFIKRIIGLPGERVIIKDGQIKIDGFILKEDYLSKGLKTVGDFDIKLGKDNYLVLGDNRYQSFDSRNWGAISRENIIGLARLRVLPFGKIGVLAYP
jgi:signal peptidase I